MIFSHIDINENITVWDIYNIAKALYEHQDNHSVACHVNNTVDCLSGNTTLQRKKIKIINEHIYHNIY